MFQNKKLKCKATFAIAEIADVALCPPLETSTILEYCRPNLILITYQLLVAVSSPTKSENLATDVGFIDLLAILTYSRSFVMSKKLQNAELSKIRG